MVVTNDKLFGNLKCLTGLGIFILALATPSCILFVKFSKHAIDLLPHEGLAYQATFLETHFKIDVSRGELMFLVDGNYARFRKGYINVRDIDSVNEHDALQKRHHMGADENIVNVHEIDIDVPVVKE